MSKLIALSARPGLHQPGLENALLLVDVIHFTNRKVRNVISRPRLAQTQGRMKTPLEIQQMQQNIFIVYVEKFC